MKLKQTLEAELTKKQLDLIPSSFEIIGSKEKAVIIIEISDALKSREKVIARKLLSLHKNVQTVLKKSSERKGKLRLRKYKLLIGNKNTEVIHKESDSLFKLDPIKVYFSPREATERLRIANQVKPNEQILVMFSGISPFSIVIAKKQPRVEIYSIELNKVAHNYALENIELNNLRNKIIALQGDVKNICPKLNKKFDRIIMPLPKEAYQFLDVAIPLLKQKGILHFYYWSSENNLFDEAIKLIKEKAKKFKRKVRILNKKKVLAYGPRKWKIVLDVLII